MISTSPAKVLDQIVIAESVKFENAIRIRRESRRATNRVMMENYLIVVAPNMESTMNRLVLYLYLTPLASEGRSHLQINPELSHQVRILT
jgi:hypothetical protein